MATATLTTDTDTRLSGAVLVTLAAFGFSSKAILIKLAYALDPTLEPISLMALRMGFALPVFLAIALWQQQAAPPSGLRRGDAGALVVIGLLGYYLASFLDFSGLQYVSAGIERLILFLYPTLVVLLSALFLGHRIGPREGIALLLGYAGIALVFSDQLATGPPGSAAQTSLGALLVLASALSFALFMMGSGVFIRKLGSVRFTTWSMTVASAATLAHFSITQPLAALMVVPEVYALALLMALVSTVLPAFLMNAGIRRIGASRASIISAGGPVMTLALAWVVLGEVMQPLQLAGTALVLAGVWSVGRRP